MTEEQIRIAIAESQGWKTETRKMYAGSPNVNGWGMNQHLGIGHQDRQFIMHPALFPDYACDLNAMHEAEKSLNFSQRNDYLNILSNLTWVEDNPEVDADFAWCSATAPQRAEAYLRTIGKWAD